MRDDGKTLTTDVDGLGYAWEIDNLAEGCEASSTGAWALMVFGIPITATSKPMGVQPDSAYRWARATLEPKELQGPVFVKTEVWRASEV